MPVSEPADDKDDKDSIARFCFDTPRRSILGSSSTGEVQTLGGAVTAPAEISLPADRWRERPSAG
jgi:hypothetical protein